MSGKAVGDLGRHSDHGLTRQLMTSNWRSVTETKLERPLTIPHTSYQTINEVQEKLLLIKKWALYSLGILIQKA